MNYWLLTTEYPPFFGGGIGTYCYQTATMLAEKGHQVSVFINDTAVSDIKTEQLENIRIIRFNPSRTKSSSFLGHVTNISYEFAHIVKYFIEKEGKPDIIESQEYLGIAYYLLQYKYLLYEWCKDVPVLITMHSPSFLYMEYNHVPMYNYPNYWICEMEFFCLEAADHIISPSSYMINELEKRFSISNKNITVIHNPYKEQDIDISSSDKGKDGEILFYGKLTAQKGAFELLEYFKQLWDQGFARPLYLLGGQEIVYHPEGISMGDLLKRKYVKYLNKRLLIFEGKINPCGLKKRLDKAEVIIIPSNNDNFPYTVLELMALGKILLVSRQGGHSEIIQDEKNGFIFDHIQPETFSEQLKKILSLNESERNKISGNAIQTVREICGHDIIYQKKSRIIENLIQRGSTAIKLFPFVHKLVSPIVTHNVSINGQLSIVIPYFNMGQYIEETVNSLQKSDYENTEIVIVNDGSTDPDSIRKLEKYRNRQGIQVIDIENKGLANARNFGAEKATGQYLAFLDADDKVKPDYYSKAIVVLGSYDNVHFVGCWTKYFDRSIKIWPCFTPEPPLILYHNLVNSSSLVYKRKSFLISGINDDKMIFPGLEDYDSVINMLENGLRGVVLPELLFEYRVRKDSMIRDISEEKKIFLLQYISNKHRKFYDNFAAGIFNLSNANGPGLYLDNPSLDLHLAKRIPLGNRFSLQLVKLIKRNKNIRTLAYKIYKALKK